MNDKDSIDIDNLIDLKVAENIQNTIMSKLNFYAQNILCSKDNIIVKTNNF